MLKNGGGGEGWRADGHRGKTIFIIFPCRKILNLNCEGQRQGRDGIGGYKIVFIRKRDVGEG